MKAKNLGLIALALAIGTTVHAEDANQANISAVELSSIKALVNTLENSNNQHEYEVKLEKIRDLLDSLSKEEVQSLKSNVITCRMTN